jgi:hypothetical protein
LSPTGLGYWQKYAPQPSHCTGCLGLHGNGRGLVMDVGICGRGNFCVMAQVSGRRPRTPDTLADRGRPALTGTNGRAGANANGSFVLIELKEVVADISIEPGMDAATSICDCDMGVSEDSDSLSAVEKRSWCEAVGVRSGSGVEALLGLNSGMTSLCGGSLCVRTWSRSVCMSRYPHLRTLSARKSCSLHIGFLQARHETFHRKLL